MRLAFVFLVLAAPVSADTYDGQYYWTGTDPVQGCSNDRYNEMGIKIEGPRIFYVETTCELNNPTPVRGMSEGLLFDAICIGEGDKWAERVMLYQTYEGVSVLSRGAVRTYTRCQ